MPSLFMRRRHQQIQKIIARNRSVIESLEARTLLSESATAQLALVSTTGTISNPVYNYDITLTNTGTTNIGSFWLAWIPGEDFLPSVPSSASSPTGWGNGSTSTPTITGSGNSSDGSAIQWIAKNNALLAAGQSLSGFDFSTVDSPTVLAGNSTQHPTEPALRSFVYQGQPFSDAGFQFTATVTPVVQPVASTTTLMSSAPSINLGDNLTLTATVAPASGTGATPTGSVTFFNGATSLQTVSLVNGSASFQTTSLPGGTDSLSAQYSGDSTYAASTSQTVSETVVAPAQESASAQLSLVSTTGTLLNPVYNYNITLTNTGTVNLGTFWFAWIPGENFLPTNPSAVASPTGWGDAAGDSATPVITHSTTSADGFGIQWVAQGSTTLAPGQSLGGFTFSTTDSPSVLAGMAPTDTSQHILTSFVYGGAPFSDAGFQFDVSPAAVTPPSAGLQPSIGTTGLPSSIVVGAKNSFTVPVTLTNLAATKVSEKATTKLFLSNDGALDGTQIQIGTISKKFSIDGNSTTTENLKITKLPAAVAAGTYYLIASTTDGQNTTLSTIDATAITAAAPTINFSAQFTSLDLSSPVVAGGATGTKAVLSVTNNGNITSTGATMINFYASPDQTAASGTLIVGKKMKLAIKPAASKTVTIPLKKIPAELLPNTYFVLVQVTDSQGHVTTVVARTNLVVTG